MSLQDRQQRGSTPAGGDVAGGAAGAGSHRGRTHQELAGLGYEQQVEALDPVTGDPASVDAGRDADHEGPETHVVGEVFRVLSRHARLRSAPPDLAKLGKDQVLPVGAQVIVREQARGGQGTKCALVQEVSADGRLGAVLGWTAGSNLGHPEKRELDASAASEAGAAVGIVVVQPTTGAEGGAARLQGALSALALVAPYLTSTLAELWGGAPEQEDDEAGAGEQQASTGGDEQGTGIEDELQEQIAASEQVIDESGGASAEAVKQKNTLETALALEEELRKNHPGYGSSFNGYGYGKGQYVCSTFTVKVLQEAGYELSKELQDQVNINISELNGLTGEPFYKKLDALVLAGDERTKGVVYALAGGGKGTEIEIGVDPLQPGDFVQYWYWTSAKHLAGHSVQVQAVHADGTVDLHGSHGGTKGVGTLTKVALHNKSWYPFAYAVRPSGNVSP
ncbi:MAG: hypothetical protein RBU45_13225 [Myxococcota bacterium]|jgi:hypothetical protein|nr:hypothetical protein [Myxococcota bacterium]